METLQEKETALAKALAAEVKLVGLFIGKAHPFVEAAMNGIGSVSDTAKITVQNLVDKGFDCLIRIAAITGSQPFIKLSVIGKNLYDDCATGKVNIIEVFRALIQSRKEVKALIAEAKARIPDAQLETDELALATDLGALAKMLALYLEGDKSKAFIEAVMEGFVSVDDTATVTIKEVVDGGFNVIKAIALLIGNNVLELVVDATQTLYDDFAGGKTNIIALWDSISASKEKIKTAMSSASKKAA